MTYANDCIQERTRGLKRIEDHTTQELNEAISKAVKKHGDEFWLLLHGIDAYMERRKRRANIRIYATSKWDERWGEKW